MENATKALLMAAGILITIIILSLAIVVYGRVSSYYQTKQGNLTQEQLAAFNDEYAAYDRNDVTGFELVSLINKTIDFNQNRVYGASNTGNSNEQLGDGYAEMSITIKIIDLPNEDLFSKGVFKYDGKNNNILRQELTKAISDMQKLESRYGAENLRKISSNKDYLEKYNSNWNTLPESSKRTVQDILGKKATENDLPDKDDLSKYEDYLAFKRAEYKCESVDGKPKIEYNNGQIVRMCFVQK